MSAHFDGRSTEPTAPPVDIKDMAATMRGFQTPLAAKQIERSIAQTSSIVSMEFIWHCAADINNRAATKGARGDTNYPEIPRMKLVPLYAWSVPVIRAPNAAFSIGRFTQHGSSLGPTGVVVSQRSMLSGESKTLLEKWYGAYGALTLPALATETDSGKAEALLLYEAVMNNVRPSKDGEPERVPGREIVIEDLPEFLTKEAPLLLRHCIEYGVMFRGDKFWPGYPAGLFKLKPESLDKGMAALENMLHNVQVTINHVMNEETGVLIISRGQLAQALAGVKDSKSRADRRDEFYLKQFPSFSMNSPEERAVRASAPTVAAIRDMAAQRSETEGLVGHALLESLNELKSMRLEASQRDEANARKFAELEAKLNAAQQPGG